MMSATNGTARKRPAKRSPEAPVPDAPVAPQELADFAAVDLREVDAQMWPVHPVLWLQPELNPGLPGSTALTIERHYKIPVPGFLDLEIAAVDCPRAPQERTPQELLPAVRYAPLESDLSLLGWDPRAEARRHRNGVEE